MSQRQIDELFADLNSGEYEKWGTLKLQKARIYLIEQEVKHLEYMFSNSSSRSDVMLSGNVQLICNINLVLKQRNAFMLTKSRQ